MRQEGGVRRLSQPDYQSWSQEENASFTGSEQLPEAIHDREEYHIDESKILLSAKTNCPFLRAEHAEMALIATGLKHGLECYT